MEIYIIILQCHKSYIIGNMATLKLKFRSSTVTGKEGMLVFQIIHSRVYRQIKTGNKLYEDEWNDGVIRVVDPERCLYIRNLKTEITEKKKRICHIIDTLERTNRNYTAGDVVKAYLSLDWHCDTFVSFTKKLIETMNNAGRVRTAETYQNTLNSFMKFMNGNDLYLGDINSEIIESYEMYLKTNGLKKNTSSFYLSILRAIYHRAVNRGIISDTAPFKKVFTGMDKTIKRALGIDCIHRLMNADFRHTSRYDFARDMFMFSFFTRGMSFVDMAYLKKNNLKNGILSYTRQKSGQQLIIRWEDCMQRIIDKYDTSGSQYLLPIITRLDKSERKQYLSKIHNINRNLREIGELMNFVLPLTLYVARHSWANIAYNSNIPVSIISEGLGHDSEKTTRIYLSSLNASIVDNANRMILESIQKG